MESRKRGSPSDFAGPHIPPIAFGNFVTRGLRVFKPDVILVLKPDHLGDFQLAEQALKLLRLQLPETVIVGVVGSWNLDRAKSSGFFDHVVTSDFFWPSGGQRLIPREAAQQIVENLEAGGVGKIDLAIDLRLDWDTREVLRHLPCDIRAGLGTSRVFPFLDISLPFFNPTLFNKPRTLEYRVSRRGRFRRPYEYPSEPVDFLRGEFFRNRFLRLAESIRVHGLRNALKRFHRRLLLHLIGGHGIELPRDFETQGVTCISTSPTQEIDVSLYSAGPGQQWDIVPTENSYSQAKQSLEVRSAFSTFGIPKKVVLKSVPTAGTVLTVHRPNGNEGPHQEEAYLALVVTVICRLARGGVFEPGK